MKKILGLLGAVMLTTTASAPVVSCGNSPEKQDDFSKMKWDFTSKVTAEALQANGAKYSADNKTINFDNKDFVYGEQVTSETLGGGFSYADLSALSIMQEQFIEANNTADKPLELNRICGLAGKDINDMVSQIKKINAPKMISGLFNLTADKNGTLSLFVIKSIVENDKDIAIVDGQFSFTAQMQEIAISAKVSDESISIVKVNLGAEHQEKINFEVLK